MRLRSSLALLLAGAIASCFAAPVTVIFQQGSNGYAGCADKELRSPAQNYGQGPTDTIAQISEF
jgi:hypothetical protein